MYSIRYTVFDFAKTFDDVLVISFAPPPPLALFFVVSLRAQPRPLACVYEIIMGYICRTVRRVHNFSPLSCVENDTRNVFLGVSRMIDTSKSRVDDRCW